MDKSLLADINHYDNLYLTAVKIIGKCVCEESKCYIQFTKKVPTEVFSKDTKKRVEKNEISDPIYGFFNCHLKAFSVLITNISERFLTLGYSFSDVPNSMLNEHENCYQKTIEEFESRETKVNFAISALTNLVGKFLYLSSNINEQLMITMQDPDITEKQKERAKKEITAMIKTALKKRSSNRVVMRSLQNGCNTSYEECRKSFEKIHCLLTNRCKGIKQLMTLFTESFNDAAVRMFDYTDTVTKELNDIDSLKWFGSTVDKKRIFRYDMFQRDFITIDMKHECFQGLEVVPKKAMCNYFPMFAGRALYNFECHNNDEIPLKKNQQVLILEKPKNGWILTIDISTKKLGFVPETYVKILGTGIGICHKTAEGVIEKGEFIAVKWRSVVNKNFGAVKTDETEVTVSSDNVYIIGGSVENID